MILLTGATGFIGSRLLPELAGDRDVRALVRRPPQIDLVEDAGATGVLGDVTDRASLDAAVEGVDAVVHLAAVIRPPSAYEEVNVGGTRNLVDAATTAGVERFVQMSVLGADPDARHPYLRSRGRAEQTVRDAGIDATVVRPSLVYGPGDHVVSLIAELAGGPVTPVPGGGDVRMAPIHVDDLVACLERIVGDPPGGIVELGGPHVATYRELVENVVDRVNPRSRVQSVPRVLAKVGAWWMQARGRETSPGEIDLLFAGDNVPDDNAAEELLEAGPRGLGAGLQYLGPVGAYGEPDLLT